mmetsp:Transcript_26206/g.46518  ORF Transcript_26206/g.46518 Transcript_26206/m.46518 type:complete len:420 (+) Transcript_26206:87-1346(+)
MQGNGWTSFKRSLKSFSSFKRQRSNTHSQKENETWPQQEEAVSAVERDDDDDDDDKIHLRVDAERPNSHPNASEKTTNGSLNLQNLTIKDDDDDHGDDADVVFKKEPKKSPKKKQTKKQIKADKLAAESAIENPKKGKKKKRHKQLNCQDNHENGHGNSDNSDNRKETTDNEGDDKNAIIRRLEYEVEKKNAVIEMLTAKVNSLEQRLLAIGARRRRRRSNSREPSNSSRSLQSLSQHHRSLSRLEAQDDPSKPDSISSLSQKIETVKKRRDSLRDSFHELQQQQSLNNSRSSVVEASPRPYHGSFNEISYAGASPRPYHDSFHRRNSASSALLERTTLLVSPSPMAVLEGKGEGDNLSVDRSSENDGGHAPPEHESSPNPLGDSVAANQPYPDGQTLAQNSMDDQPIGSVNEISSTVR